MKQVVKLREYQSPASDYAMSHAIAILAMAAGSGKTETAIHIICRYLHLNPGARILILAHSTNVLKDNFYERLVSLGLGYMSSTTFESDKQIHVSLPNSKHKIVGKYDFLIVDEAHENYLAKRVQSIIKSIKPSKQLLLTASPSVFIKKGGYNIFTLALNELPKEFFAKLAIELVATKAYWKNKYNPNGTLLKNYEMSKEEITKALDKIIDSLLERLRTKISAKDFNLKNWKYKMHTSRIGYLFHKLEKTVFFSKSIKQSKQIYDILKSKGINCALSHSENDKRSEIVSDFKNGKYDVLVVVDRARLGYSDNNLYNIVDMSGTHNPDLIYQILSRVVRGNQSMQKFYLKLTTTEPGMKDYTHACTCAALMLTDHKYLSTFNGNNFNGIVVPVIKTKRIVSTSGLTSKSKKKVKLKFPEFTNDVIEMFDDILNNQKNTASIYKLTTLGECRTILLNDKERWNHENVREEAKKYNSRKEFELGSLGAYKYANKHGIIDEVCSHMEKIFNSYTEESIHAEAKKYKTILEFRKKAGKFYQAASKRKILNKIFSHMKFNKKPSGYWNNKQNCIEVCKLCRNISDVENKYPAAYKAIKKNKWDEEMKKYYKFMPA